MNDTLQMAVNAFLAIMARLLFAEFSPWRRPAAVAVITAICLASAGTTNLCFIAKEMQADHPDVSPLHKSPGHNRFQNQFGAGAKLAEDAGDEDSGDDSGANGGDDGEPEPAGTPASGKIESARH